MDVNGVAVMRRRSDGWLNATQILKVAGVDKGKRTKILEKEILPGEHEKIQGGYGKYQGTWISYSRGREFCRQYGVEELLRPLLDYDTASDGHGASNIDTPTKEQALAASRKRFFNAQADQKMLATNENTYFQNISPTASNALAAMSKAARYDSPMPPRPSGSQSQHRLGASQQHMQPQYAPVGSQQSMHSFVSDGGQDHSMYAPINIHQQPEDGQEPPRKRMKQAVAQDIYSQMDPIFHQSEVQQQQQEMAQAQYEQIAERGPVSLPPLPGDDKNFEEKRLALLDLFADSSRTDFTSHRAILNLSGEDLDTPLDPSANTALHWAATLARVGLMRLLISRGANIFRGNVVGQTALMSAVQVNNSLDHSCFPEMLDVLGPLIEIRDAQGRTVLHHIAVSSGIKGRSISSRYYLESLLEFVVRSGSSQESANRPISLGRFMAEVVNVQDKAGNTALNLVARIGNRAIINQLDELGADFGVANFTGMKPADFGVKSEKQGYRISQGSSSTSGTQPQQDGQDTTKTASQIEQIKEEIFASMFLSVHNLHILTVVYQRHNLSSPKQQLHIQLL
jgi:regulatory protein SWI6